jgi:DNA polymerase-3 subunit epsilon
MLERFSQKKQSHQPCPLIGSDRSDRAERMVVLDFETTGLTPRQGDRVIEIGAVAIESGAIAERYRTLVNPGKRVSSFIEEYTGISNTMLKDAPSAAEAFPGFIEFLGNAPLFAHNAGFDSRFLDAELALLGKRRRRPMACSMLIARRIYPSLKSHSLENLVRTINLPTSGVHHRALADAEMTGHLVLNLTQEIKSRSGLDTVPFAVYLALAKTSKHKVDFFLQKLGTELEAHAR